MNSEAASAAVLRVQIDAVTISDYLQGMRTVGIKQLKARLSEYVRAAQAGETVLVTLRDEIVAELRPPQRPAAPPEVETRLRELAAAGVVTRAELPKQGWNWRAAGLGLPDRAAERLLDELRAER